jgi:hypothetical protein
LDTVAAHRTFGHFRQRIIPLKFRNSERTSNHTVSAADTKLRIINDRTVFGFLERFGKARRNASGVLAVQALVFDIPPRLVAVCPGCPGDTIGVVRDIFVVFVEAAFLNDRPVFIGEFSVFTAGWRTMFNPLVAVVHFAGNSATSATDTSR